MENTKEIAKRNNRNPGHCWQDNELYDVFQPVIGALAAHVFAQMTRWCYGHEVRMGLRELAEEAAVSRSTAHRATLMMQALGMIKIRGGRGSAATTYDLLDLKEAARALGAQYDKRRGSHVLNHAQIANLKKLLLEIPGCVSVGDANNAEDSVCVSEGDANNAEDSVCVSEGDANGGGNPEFVSQFVSQKEGVCVPKQGVPLISKDTKTYKNPSPAPSRREGGEARNSRDAEKPPGDAREESAVESVMVEVNLADERLRPVIRGTLRQYAAKERLSPGEAAQAMIGAWREYRNAVEWLRFAWSPRKFFVHGHWVNQAAWPYDRDRTQREREARVGVA